MNFFKKGFKILLQRNRQRRIQKALLNFVVIIAMQREIAQVVLGKKLIEDVGCDDDRRRNSDPCTRKLLRNAARAQQMPHEGQAAGLTSQRTGADPQKTGFGWLEGVGLEIADENFVLLAAVSIDGFDQIGPQMLGAVEVGDLAWPQFRSQGKFSPCHEPVRKMIPLRVI